MADITIKIATVGDAACGKSCLLKVFTTGKFPGECVPEITENYSFDIEVDGRAIELALFSCTVCEDYERLRPRWYPHTDVFLICFAIDSPASLESIPTRWAPEVNHHCPKVPILLVGNKKELRNDPQTIERLQRSGQEPVALKDGEAMAARIGAHEYLECSAITSDGVARIFETATQLAISEKRKKSSGKGCSIS